MVLSTPPDADNAMILEYCRPKATFWLHISNRTQHQQNQTRAPTALLKAAHTAPFLAFEFEEEEGIREAYKYRMALSSAVILHNDFRLRLQALLASGNDPWRQAACD